MQPVLSHKAEGIKLHFLTELLKTKHPQKQPRKLEAGERQGR